jgi:hypothetical protein
MLLLGFKFASRCGSVLAAKSIAAKRQQANHRIAAKGGNERKGLRQLAVGLQIGRAVAAKQKARQPQKAPVGVLVISALPVHRMVVNGFDGRRVREFGRSRCYLGHRIRSIRPDRRGRR